MSRIAEFIVYWGLLQDCVEDLTVSRKLHGVSKGFVQQQHCEAFLVNAVT